MPATEELTGTVCRLPRRPHPRREGLHPRTYVIRNCITGIDDFFYVDTLQEAIADAVYQWPSQPVKLVRIVRHLRSAWPPLTPAAGGL